MEYIPDAEAPSGSMRATPAVAGDVSELGGGESPNVLHSYYDHDGIITSQRRSSPISELLRHRNAKEALR